MNRVEFERKLREFVDAMNHDSYYHAEFIITNQPEISLNSLRGICTKVFDTHSFMFENRKSDIVFMRQIFCKFANAIGFTDADVARVLKQNRTSVTLARHKIDGYLEVKDKPTMVYCKLINDEIFKYYGRNILGGDISDESVS